MTNRGFGPCLIGVLGMEIRDNVFVAILVVIIAVGALSTYALSTLVDDDGQYDVTRNYTVTGTADGREIIGTAECRYTPESDLYRTYQFSVETEGYDIPNFGIIFDLNDTPLSDIFHYMNTIEDNGIELSIWEESFGDSDYTFYIGELCEVHRVTIESKAGTVVLELMR